MTEPVSSSAGAGLLLAKLLPAGAGAVLMVLVDPPENKRELFTRLFVGLAMSVLFTGTSIDFLHSMNWFSFLERQNVEHICAVASIWGGCGWFAVGGLSMIAKRFKADPMGTVKELKP